MKSMRPSLIDRLVTPTTVPAPIEISEESAKQLPMLLRPTTVAARQGILLMLVVLSSIVFTGALAYWVSSWQRNLDVGVIIGRAFALISGGMLIAASVALLASPAWTAWRKRRRRRLLRSDMVSEFPVVANMTFRHLFIDESAALLQRRRWILWGLAFVSGGGIATNSVAGGVVWFVAILIWPILLAIMLSVARARRAVWAAFALRAPANMSVNVRAEPLCPALMREGGCWFMRLLEGFEVDGVPMYVGCLREIEYVTVKGATSERAMDFTVAIVEVPERAARALVSVSCVAPGAVTVPIDIYPYYAEVAQLESIDFETLYSLRISNEQSPLATKQLFDPTFIVDLTANGVEWQLHDSQLICFFNGFATSGHEIDRLISSTMMVYRHIARAFRGRSGG